MKKIALASLIFLSGCSLIGEEGQIDPEKVAKAIAAHEQALVIYGEAIKQFQEFKKENEELLQSELAMARSKKK